MNTRARAAAAVDLDVLSSLLTALLTQSRAELASHSLLKQQLQQVAQAAVLVLTAY